MAKTNIPVIEEQYEIPPILPDTPARSDIPAVEPISNTVSPVPQESVVNAGNPSYPAGRCS